MEVRPCPPYRARVDRTDRLDRLPDRSVFKLYFISITGRADPARYEWAPGPMTFDATVAALRALPLRGVGFVTAFPHITKVFRFAPAAETVLHVRAFRTADLAPLDLARDDGFVEFACYAEAAIAADEYRAWAEAPDVATWLRSLSPFRDGPVAHPGKLRAYAHTP